MNTPPIVSQEAWEAARPRLRRVFPGEPARHRRRAQLPAYRVDAADLPHGGTTDNPYDPGESLGVSAFVLDDGVVFHTCSAYERGIDTLWGMYQWLDRAPRARNQQRRQPWYLRHDGYDKR